MRFLIAAAPAPNAHDSKAQPEGDFDEGLFAAYMKYNEELQKAGVLVASEGLNPGTKGARVGVSGGKRVLLDGPFAESKELVGGFYLIEVGSLDEAVAWALKAPSGMGSDDVLTIHPLTSAQDIPPHLLAICRQVAPTWSESFSKGK